MQALSSRSEQGPLFTAVCGPLSLWWLLPSWSTGSRRTGLSGCGSWTLEHRLSSCTHGVSCSAACGILPDQGSNPCPLHWLGGFLTTAPRGKSLHLFLIFMECFILFIELFYKYATFTKFQNSNYIIMYIHRSLISIPTHSIPHSKQFLED